MSQKKKKKIEAIEMDLNNYEDGHIKSSGRIWKMLNKVR